MPIFRDIIITWNGVDHSVTPSMRLMRSIEMADVSLTDIAVRTMQGRPPLSMIAFVLQKMLASAGCYVTDDEVYAKLMGGDTDHARKLVDAVLFAFSPQVEDGKNPDAPLAN